MLDCSHSHDPLRRGSLHAGQARRARAAHLIRTQFPGDALKVVLFHDSAEEIPLAHARARSQVGPYHTNTREGLQARAAASCERQQKDMRQIIMITDGKPSALTMPDGRIYKNCVRARSASIVADDLRGGGRLPRAGIMINTFMLARDRALVEFVKRVSEICRGKAYFTTTMTLGRYVLMDFLKRKVETIH